jgi:hypothetical protein
LQFQLKRCEYINLKVLAALVKTAYKNRATLFLDDPWLFATRGSVRRVRLQ